MVEIETGAAEPAVANDVAYNYATVSPVGTRFIVNVNRDDGMEIWMMDLEGNDLRRVRTRTAWAMMPRWSPDGLQIAYGAAETPPFMGGAVEIHVIGVDGNNDRQLTTEETVSEYPCWSPDGNRIVFQSFRDGDFELYVMNVDGSGMRALTDNEHFDGRPSWGPTLQPF